MWVGVVMALMAVTTMMASSAICLWRRRLASAFAFNAIAWIMIGTLSLVFYQYDWVKFGMTQNNAQPYEPRWGGFGEWFYLLPYVIAMVSLVAAIVVAIVSMVRRRVDRAALAPQELSTSDTPMMRNLLTF